MVVKIHKSSCSMKGVLDYNIRKTEGCVAHVIGTANIGSDDEEAIREVFSRYERLNIRSRNVSFHMSINPSEGEAMDDGTAFSLVTDIMAGLGYSGQPLAVFRHEDTGRVHYHCISIRTRPDGRKIRDTYERRKCQEILAGLSIKYGFTVGKGQGMKQGHTAPGKPAARFNRALGDITCQMTDIFTECLEYRFTTEAQFIVLLNMHGISAVSRKSSDGRPVFVLQGLDRKGSPCTGIIRTDALDSGLYDKFAIRMARCRMRTENLRTVKSRVSGIITWGAGKARDLTHLERMLARQGIILHVSRTSAGEIFGTTFIDLLSRSVFKGSELSIPGISSFRNLDKAVAQSNIKRVHIKRKRPSAGYGQAGQSKEKDIDTEEIEWMLRHGMTRN